MNDRINGLLLKNCVHRVLIQHIYIIKCQLLARDLLYTLQCLLTGIIEIVHYYYFIAAVQQLYACMAADISGAAGY